MARETEPAAVARRLGALGRVAVAAILIGVAARIALVATSFGSNDMGIWTGFVTEIRSTGLWQLYSNDWWFNHPPIMGWGAASLHELAETLGIRFSALFKSVMVVADVAVLWLLWTIHRERGLSPALLALAVYACNPVAILISSHHGNTDSLCAALLLLAARQQDRKSWFTAGLALAAAGNVKIVAAIAVPGLIALVRNRHDFARLVLGGLVGAIPSIIAVTQAGSVFLNNVFAYGSFRGPWGAVALARVSQDALGVGWAQLDLYEAAGRVILVVAIIAMAVVGRRRSWTPYQAAVAPYVAFLALTPGWGIQYHVWLVPILAAVSTRQSARYGLIVGAYLTALYLFFLTGDIPLVSDHTKPLPIGLLAIGLISWGWMLTWFVGLVRGKSPGLKPVRDAVPSRRTPALDRTASSTLRRNRRLETT